MAAVFKLVSITESRVTAPESTDDGGGGEGLHDVVSLDSDQVALDNSAQLGDSWHQQVHAHGCCNGHCRVVEVTQREGLHCTCCCSGSSSCPQPGCP